MSLRNPRYCHNILLLMPSISCCIDTARLHFFFKKNSVCNVSVLCVRWEIKGCEKDDNGSYHRAEEGSTRPITTLSKIRLWGDFSCNGWYFPLLPFGFLESYLIICFLDHWNWIQYQSFLVASSALGACILEKKEQALIYFILFYWYTSKIVFPCQAFR